MERRRTIIGDVMEDLMYKRLSNTMTEYSSNEVTSTILYGFAGQSEIKSVSLPNCKILGGYTFLNCKKLSKIYLPALIRMDYQAFRGCASLTEFITNENFDSRVDNSTFEECDNLTKIDLYHINSLGIGGYAFNCKNLVTLIIRNTDFVPKIASNAFGAATTLMNTGTGRIYVPASMVDAYKEADNWKKYAEQILSIEELEG